MSTRITFLINPLSGGGDGGALLSKIKSLSQKDNSISVFTLDEIVPEQLPSSEVIVICGGDGTISSLAPKVAEKCSKIGVLPLGTGNDLARTLDISSELHTREANEIVSYFLKSSYRELPIFRVKFNQSESSARYLLNYLSIGFDARVAYLFDKVRSSKIYTPLRSRALNFLTYGLCGLYELLTLNHRIEAIEIRCDGEFFRRSGRSLIISNIDHYMGGVKLRDKDQKERKLLDCFLVDSIFTYIRLMLGFYAYDTSALRVVAGEKLSISIPTRTSIQIDGEPILSRDIVTITIEQVLTAKFICDK